MNVIAVNGSPRKDWNTAILLESALEGAGSTGAQTDLVHRYDPTYKGCTSCFSSVHYDVLFENHALVLRILKGTTEVLTSHETWQFDDCSVMNAAMFDVAAKAKRRAELFPLECQKAFDMGARLAKS